VSAEAGLESPDEERVIELWRELVSVSTKDKLKAATRRNALQQCRRREVIVYLPAPSKGGAGFFVVE